jgi:hypothetical protein
MKWNVIGIGRVAVAGVVRPQIRESGQSYDELV